MGNVVSVILCTHNPRTDYFRRTLEALQKQTLPVENWEFLLIDNASQERVANTWDISWHPQGRHVLEEKVGLTFARLRGIEESKASLLVFVDDDNVLAPDFLERAAALRTRYPFLATFGAGRLEPEFEVPLPPQLTSSLGLLALRTVPTALWTNNVEDFYCTPFGAGLCVTRQVAEAYLQLIERFNATSIIDRRGNALFSGGDDVFSWVALTVGQGFGVFPELQITHLISAGRLTESYFVRFIRDHALSHGVLRYLRSGILPKRIDLPGYVGMLLHGLRNGSFSMRCRWAEAQGQAGAARFILENALRPVHLTMPLTEEVPLKPEELKGSGT
jgi:glycosyltransferase involved in cell wall biosynthesis